MRADEGGANPSTAAAAEDAPKKVKKTTGGSGSRFTSRKVMFGVLALLGLRAIVLVRTLPSDGGEAGPHTCAFPPSPTASVTGVVA